MVLGNLGLDIYACRICDFVLIYDTLRGGLEFAFGVFKVSRLGVKFQDFGCIVCNVGTDLWSSCLDVALRWVAEARVGLGGSRFWGLWRFGGFPFMLN